MLASRLPILLGSSVQVDHVPKVTQADYRSLMTERVNEKASLAALRMPRGGIEDDRPLRTVLLRLVAVDIFVAGLLSAQRLGVLPALKFETWLDWWKFEEQALGFFAHRILSPAP